MKILVIKLRQIGDVLLVTPALRVLKRVYPGCHLAVLVNRGTESVLPDFVDEVFVYDRGWKGLSMRERISNEIGLMRDIRGRGFDIVLNLTEGDRGIITGIMSGAPVRAGLYKKGLKFEWKRLFLTKSTWMSWHNHAVEQNLDVLRLIGAQAMPEDLEIRLAPDSKAVKEVVGLLEAEGIRHGERFVQIHPTSPWLFKAWDDGKMAGIIDYLQNERGIRVVITCQSDPEQAARVDRIISLSKSSPVNLTGKTTLRQLTALSSLSMFFFGIDTAPMHMAAAAGKPVLAIFGPSDEKNFGPWSNRAVVISAPMKCRPCRKKGCGNSGESRCMSAVTTEEVTRELDKMIGEGKETS